MIRIIYIGDSRWPWSFKEKNIGKFIWQYSKDLSVNNYYDHFTHLNQCKILK